MACNKTEQKAINTDSDQYRDKTIYNLFILTT